MRSVAVSRKNWLLAESEGGDRAAAIAFTFIEIAKLNDVDLQTRLAHVVGQTTDHKISRIDDLLPWRYAAAVA